VTKGLFNDIILKIKKNQHGNNKNVNSFDLETALEYLSHNKWIKVLDVLQQCLKEF